MSDVTLTVHRATDQIGGNCIEIAAPCGRRVILDVGRPLDAPSDATGLIPASLDLTIPADVLISHPHQDHYGLLGETPIEWPVHCGAATEKLMRITVGVAGKVINHSIENWESGRTKKIGPFALTPYLTDHSAFDAHMLLLEVAGKRIMYSGDFRTHGRKAALVERLMASPPLGIDVLLMEGTNLGANKPLMHEADLEDDFVELFSNTVGRVFVSWSAQNIDRTVTLYRACLKSGRTLVLDLYSAEVLEILAAHGRIPQPDWDRIKIVITSGFSKMYRAKGRGDFVDRMAGNGISARALAENPSKWVIMIRPSLIRDFAKNGVVPTSDDAWSWSLWRGYLTQTEDGQRLNQWFTNGGATARHIHTSGHASPADLRKFATAMSPTWMIPIHGVGWDDATDGFPPIRRLRDGEPMVI